MLSKKAIKYTTNAFNFLIKRLIIASDNAATPIIKHTVEAEKKAISKALKNFAAKKLDAQTLERASDALRVVYDEVSRGGTRFLTEKLRETALIEAKLVNESWAEIERLLETAN